jgi:hypothetical protein
VFLSDLPSLGHSKPFSIFAHCSSVAWRTRFAWEGITHDGVNKTGLKFFPKPGGKSIRCT